MDKIDSLIKTLTEFKEELNKNMNASYGATVPNMTKEEMDKASKDPSLAPKEVKVKALQAQIDAGTYKPDPKKIAEKMLKEELTCSENGQWNIVEKADKPKIKLDGKPSKTQHAAASSGSAHPAGNADHPSTLSIHDVKKLIKDE